MASLPMGATSETTTILRIAAPEFFRFCEFCRLPFPEYDQRHGRIVEFCVFCGTPLLRVVRLEDAGRPGIVQSPQPGSVIGTLINRPRSPRQSLLESFNVGRRSDAYPSLRSRRGSSPADERSDALDWSSAAVRMSGLPQASGSRRSCPGAKIRYAPAIDWKAPQRPTSPSVHFAEEIKVESAPDPTARALATPKDTIPSTGPVAQAARGSTGPPPPPTISSGLSYRQQKLLRQLPKYDFSRWEWDVNERDLSTQHHLSTQPEPEFQLTKRAKKLENCAEKLRQEIHAKELAKHLAGARGEGLKEGDIRRWLNSSGKQSEHQNEGTTQVDKGGKGEAEEQRREGDDEHLSTERFDET